MAVLGGSRTRDEIDPRIERSRETVLRATLEQLAEMGYGELTIEAVAARSGVAKSTIYRHWSGKLELVTEAFARLRRFDEGLPPPGPVRDRVAALLTEMAAAVKDPDLRGACVVPLIDASARNADVAALCRDLAERGMQRLVAVLDDGVAAGEIPEATDTTLLADALTGPILLRSLFHREGLDPDEVPALLDLLLPPT